MTDRISGNRISLGSQIAIGLTAMALTIFVAQPGRADTREVAAERPAPPAAGVFGAVKSSTAGVDGY